MKIKFLILTPVILIALAGLSACFKDDPGIIKEFYSYPNPYQPKSDGNATFKVVFTTTGITEYQWSLKLYSENGNLVYASSNTVAAVASPLLISWPGRDNLGHVVSTGVYTAVIRIEVTKDISGYAAGAYQERCYTVIH